MKTNNLAIGNVATMAVLAVTLTTVMIVGASADVYHHPYHRPVHRVVMHHEVHPVNHRSDNRHDEDRDTDHPHR
jgi:hypothetical protein